MTSTILQEIKEFSAFPPYHPLSHSLLLFPDSPGLISRSSKHSDVLTVRPIRLTPYYDRAYFPEIPSRSAFHGFLW